MDEKAEKRLMRVLSEHHDKARAISMRALFAAVYGEYPADKINGTRRLRALITELRNEGVPICHSWDSNGGGYYLASAGKDLDEHCGRIHAKAMRLLVMEARLRKGALPGMRGQISFGCAWVAKEGK